MGRRRPPVSSPIAKPPGSASISFSELVYHKLMTPSWLLAKATWDATKPSSADLVLEIEKDSREYEGILWVRLLPGGIINIDDAFTVKITAILEHNNPIAQSNARRDPMSIMIADGDYACGIQIRDPNDYANNSIGPYLGIEGEVSGTVLNDPTTIEPQGLDRSQGISTRRWPQVFNITLTQTEASHSSFNILGTCSSSIDGGHSTSFLFANTLDTSHPLDLRLYRAEEEETYNIKSVEVSIFRDCSYS